MVNQDWAVQEKIEAAIKGDATAMGLLFQWYRPRLYAHALHLCSNTPLAQDALQETFLSAFTHIHSLRDTSVFYPWLRKILSNHCFLLLRKEKIISNYKNTLPKDVFIQTSIEQCLDQMTQQWKLHDILNQLSDELRVCALLRYFSNFNSYEEIALILHIPIGTVRSRLYAAREKMVKLYTQMEDSDDEALNQSRKWSELYTQQWGETYDNLNVRNELLEHFQPLVHIRFSSGKTNRGRIFIEKELNDDLTYGSRFNVKEVTSCGDLSLIEGTNVNTVEYPDRCAPSTIFVAFRNNDKIDAFCIFDSPRSL